MTGPVPPVVHEYVYPGVPPEAFAVSVCPTPTHTVGFAVIFIVIVDGTAIDRVAEAVQPFTEVPVTV